MEKKEYSINCGLGSIVLTVMFFIAKILGYINWSWVWVFAPIWIPFAMFAIMFVVAIIWAKFF